ncbi:hypothetical protein DDZ18_00515 [Marinicauda salina]|uniref:Aminoglycoside phosphotransferase domain-containing protein n=1 Tax=Marinicauda salina TaxID=2135793 RepID=A0A2U2BVU1_9PROT|nr:bifunctional aminoglycoside phosphotransferase/ATP-binding protein [Marinicauda salina]PWE18133.1 hypothetical protein DDZ18_00515 [Marinicauda salina]
MTAGGLDPELDAFLGDPATHPGAETVERIETHGAVVFLAGDAAWKVKKPVDLGYLDFSTLEKRRAACEREIELNRPAAPQIYLGVSAITRQPDGRLAIDDGGEVVECAVRMRRFPQDRLLDRLAEAGELDVDLMARLAAVIRAAHERAEPATDRDGYADLVAVLDDNERALSAAGDRLDPDEVKTSCEDARAALDAHADLMRRRSREGYVRRCHGDLHLANIVLLDHEPALFDALEFDEALATTDVLYDLAFLLMDLAHRGLTPHAARLLAHYLAPDPPAALDGLALLPAMTALRAQVRAKVALDRGGDGATREARAYLDLSLDLLDPPAPRLVAVGGLSGTGKSTLAAALAPELGGSLGALVIRADLERKALAGVAETDSLGPEYYTAEMSRAVYARMRDKAGRALAAGHSVVLDAVHARPDERDAAAALAREHGVGFDGLWLEASPDTLVARVGARSGDASDADAAVVRRQLGYDVGAVDWTVLDAGVGIDETRRRALETLERA